MEVNFGGKPFKYPPGNGYKGIQQADPSELAQRSVEPSGKQGQRRKPLALIIEPTKDLALQTDAEITKFMKYLPAPRLDQVCLIGGQPAGQQIKVSIKASSVYELHTGITGWCRDSDRNNWTYYWYSIPLLKSPSTEFLDNGNLDLSAIRFFVLDEADQLIMNNEAEVMKIWNAIPKSSSLQVKLDCAAELKK